MEKGGQYTYGSTTTWKLKKVVSLDSKEQFFLRILEFIIENQRKLLSASESLHRKNQEWIWQESGLEFCQIAHKDEENQGFAPR